MNKIIKRLFTPLAVFAMAIGIGVSVNAQKDVVETKAATTTTTLTFPQLASDSSSAFTSATITTATGSLKDTPNGNFIATTTQTNNVYAGVKGFKYGSSSTVGKWTFNTTKVVSKIVVVFDKFGTDASSKGKVTSSDDSQTATTDVITGPTTLTLDNIASDTFVIEALVKRLYLTSIEFTHEVDSGNIPATGVSISPKTMNLVAGGSTANLIAVVSPVDATDKSVAFSSNDNTVATVSQAGLVTPLKQGVATITVTTNSGNHTDTTIVTVDYAALTSISLNKSTSNIFLGDTELFTVTANPTTASNIVTWSSSNEAVATVANGTVTAVALGNATITATSTQDNTKTATVDISVLPVPVWARFTKITSESQLYFGATYIIANSDGSAAMSYQAAGNNIPKVTTTIDSGKIVDSNNIMKVKLGLGTVTGSYSLQSISSDSLYNGLYLHAASNSSNYLRLKETKDANASWSISFTSETPLLVAQGAFTRETMQYNTGSSLFAAYDTASQSAVALYLDEASVDHNVSATMVAEEINTGLGNAASSTVDETCSSIYAILESAYTRLNPTAKNIFDTSTDSAFVSARARMAFLAAWVAANTPSGRSQSPITTNSTVMATFIIGVIGISSLLGYYFVTKKTKFQ